MKYQIALLMIPMAMRLSAQNTLRPALYFNNMNYYNAASNLSDTASVKGVMLYVKKKYIDSDNEVIWDKPANVYLNYIGNINTKSFLNISYISDGYSFHNRHTLYGGYGRIFKIGKSQTINAAVRAVFNFDKMKWEKLGQIQDKPSSNLHLTPELDLGLQYQWRHLIVGVSWKNMFSSAYKVDGNAIFREWRELYINASYTFGLFRRNLHVSPYVLYFKERDIEFDMGVNFTIGKYIDVSYCLRTFELRSIYSTRVKVFKDFQLGMAVDHSSVFTDTNVDWMISYQF